jgi:hypothetical protein
MNKHYLRRMNHNIDARGKESEHNCHPFLYCKHMSIAVPHKSISGETALCTLCAMFPSGLPRGPIVLRILLETYLRSKPWSAQVTNKWFRCRLELHMIEWKGFVEENHKG